MSPVRLAGPAGAFVTAQPQADGSWRIEASDAVGLAFRLGTPPHFGHAEATGSALLLVGQHGGTHYSLAVTPTAEGFVFDFAETWSDRDAGKRLEVRFPAARPAVDLSFAGLDQVAWDIARDRAAAAPPAALRRAVYRLIWPISSRLGPDPW